MLLLPLVALTIVVSIHDPAEASDTPYNVVCYFESWTVYRPGNGKFDVEDIDPALCTRHIYMFAGLNSSHMIYSLDPYNDLYDNFGRGAYLRFTGMKEANPQVKTMLCIGGWSDGSYQYSQMAASAEYRATFVDSVLQFLAKYNFDGLDVDWEYPTLRGGSPEDKENFVLLLKELSEALRPRGLLLTATLSASTQVIDVAYDLNEMARYLDFMNVLTFDYFSVWESDSFLRHYFPLYVSQKDIDHGEPYTSFNVNYTIHYYLQKGIEPSQMIMGFPLYGNGFEMQDPTQHEPYDLSAGPMAACPYTQGAGYCNYNELCEKIFSQAGWTDVHDSDMGATYSYNDINWIGWDDLESVQQKLDYLKTTGIGGAMLRTINGDDFRGVCGPKYPIASLIWSELNGA